MKTDVSINLDKYVTIAQIQQAWNISRTTIYDLINEKAFTKYKVRGGTRLKLSEVNSYMESQTEKAKK